MFKYLTYICYWTKCFSLWNPRDKHGYWSTDSPSFWNPPYYIFFLNSCLSMLNIAAFENIGIVRILEVWYTLICLIYYIRSNTKQFLPYFHHIIHMLHGLYRITWICLKFIQIIFPINRNIFSHISYSLQGKVFTYLKTYLKS